MDNIGSSENYGLELEGQWAVAKGFDLRMNMGYLHTEVLEYAPVDSETGMVTDLAGKQLTLAPEFNGNIAANYTVPVTDKIQFNASMEYDFKSEFYFNFENDAKQEAYGLLNGRLGFSSKGVDLHFWAKNISDVKYFSYGYGVGSYRAASFGLPQTYGISTTFKF